MKFSQFMVKSELIKLNQIHQLVFSELLRQLNELNLNYHESLVLLALFFEEQETVNPSELATVIGVSKDQLSQAFAKLEKKNLLRRKIDPNDQRRRILLLTAQGKKNCTQLVGLFDKKESRLEKLLQHPLPKI